MARRNVWFGALFLVVVAGAAIYWLTGSSEPSIGDGPSKNESTPSPGIDLPPPAKKPRPAPEERDTHPPAKEPAEPPAGEVEAKRSVNGRVVSFEDGKGIAGARVELWRGWPSTWWKTQPVKPLAVFRTDADGRFTIPPMKGGEDLEGALVVKLKGWGTQFEEVYGLHPEVEIEVELGAGYTVEGLVTDQNRRPLAGARVFAWCVEDIELFYRRDQNVPRPLPQTVTGGDGRYRLPDLAPEGIAALDPQGWLGVGGDLRASGQVVTCPIRVLRRGSLVVEIFDAVGRPVPLFSSRSRLLRKEGDGWIEAVACWMEDGKLSFPNLPTGEYAFVVWSDRHRSEKRGVVIRAGAEVRLVVECRAGLRLAGRVQDAAGKPLGGVNLEAAPVAPVIEGLDLSVTAKSGKDGRFVLEGLSEGKVRLRATGQGLLSRDMPVDAGTEGMVVQLFAEPALRGRICVAAGEIAPETVWIKMGRKGNQYGADVSPDGTFDQSVDVGSFDVVVHAEGWPPSPPRPVTLRPGEVVDLGELKRPPGRSLCGRVFGPDGEPVAGAEIHVDFEQWYVQLDAKSAVDGRFAVPDVPPWEGYLRVDGAPNLPFVEKRIGASEAAEQVIRLTRGGRIQGAVEDAAGRPISNAIVYVMHPGGPGQSPRYVRFGSNATTSGKGRFRTRVLPRGVYHLRVLADGETEGPDVVVRDGETVEVKLRIPEKARKHDG